MTDYTIWIYAMLAFGAAITAAVVYTFPNLATCLTSRVIAESLRKSNQTPRNPL